MVYSIIVSAVFLLNTREVAFFVVVIIVHVAWLDEQLLDLLLDGGDLGLDLRALVLGDGRGDDRPGHAARATQSLLGLQGIIIRGHPYMTSAKFWDFF